MHSSIAVAVLLLCCAVQALSVLSRLVGNVAHCDNSIDKYRTIKTTNSQLQECIWSVAGAPEILKHLGWQAPPAAAAGSEDAVEDAGASGSSSSAGNADPTCWVLPACAELPLLRAAAARLQRLADKKGHSGAATPIEPEVEQADAAAALAGQLQALDAGESSSGQPRWRPRSQFYNAPGFRYQQHIWHCTVCDHAINDGSERLWTGSFEAPQGEYRYSTGGVPGLS